jgi:hypothetical protein
VASGKTFISAPAYCIVMVIGYRQRLPVHVPGNRDAEHVQNGRTDVDQSGAL